MSVSRSVTVVFGLAVLSVACSAGPDAGGTAAETPDASASDRPVGTGARIDSRSDVLSPALHAAYVRARQSEGALDPAFHVGVDGIDLLVRSEPRGVEARFQHGGVTIVGDGVTAVLETRAIRCGGVAVRIPASAPRIGPRPNRVELDHAVDGVDMREWYESGPLGVEQGFDVAADDCDELAIEIHVTGARVELEGDAVRLRDGDAALRYDALFAEDSTGEPLASRIAAHDDTIELVVQTRGAAWPVVVDPLIYTEQAELRPQDIGDGQPGDGLGAAIAVDGDVAVVGAPTDDVASNLGQGSAYVFVRTGPSWALEAKLIASDGAAGDQFGTSVALNAGTAIIGAPRRDVGGAMDAGAAYVFVRTGTTWTEQARLSASDGAANDLFGFSVAVSGDTGLVGAYGHRSTWDQQGAAYVYVRAGTTWAEQAQLVASDGGLNHHLGYAVALVGDTALIGAPGAGVGALLYGATYVFTRSGAAWTHAPRLVATGASTTSNGFGGRISMTADAALIAGGSHVYFFVRAGGTWVQHSELTPPTTSGFFGSSVFLGSDGTAIVGAPSYDTPMTDSGAAYVFTFSGAAWSHTATLQLASNGSIGTAVWIGGGTAMASGVSHVTGQTSVRVWTLSGSSWTHSATLGLGRGEAGDAFGQSVAISDDTIVVGAPNDRDGTTLGGVYVFRRVMDAWLFEARLDGTRGFGAAVAISGDRALVGSPSEDGTSRGAAYFYLRSGTTWTLQARVVADSIDRTSWAEFGSSVALEGDLALIGTHRNAAYVFAHDGTVWSREVRLLATGGSDSDGFGLSVALSRDTAIIGSDRAGAYAFVRSTTPFGPVWAQQAHMTGPSAVRFGRSVAISGDTALLGAEWELSGRVHVMTRSGATWSEEAVLSAPSGPQFGASVAIVGDRALVGAPYDWGSAHFFSRTGTTWSAPIMIGPGVRAAGDLVGTSVALGPTETVVGAPSRDGTGAFGNPDEGRVYVGAVTTAPLGSPCAGGGDCTSGFCVDGVCCDTVCSTATNDCLACRESLTGLPDGQCGALSSSAAPTVVCRMSAGPCDAPETCVGGSGACPADLMEPADRECSPASCAAGLETPAGLCNGTDPACTAPSSSPCDPYACGATSCRSSCTADADCAAGFYCAADACVPQVALGGACVESRACSTGACVDGFCCATACSGQCESCGEPGREGECIAVTGEPRGIRTACDGDGSSCSGTCDGVNAASCTYPADGTSCGTGEVCSSHACIARPADAGLPSDGGPIATADSGIPPRDGGADVDGAMADAGAGADAGDAIDPGGGCGCAVPVSRRSPYGWIAAALAAVFVRRRRRR